VTSGTYVVTGVFGGKVDLGHASVEGGGMYLGKLKFAP